MKVHTCLLLQQKGTMTRSAAAMDGNQDLELFWIISVNEIDPLVARPDSEFVWIHLGILRTRGGELVASGNLLYCFVAYDAPVGRCSEP